MIFGNFQLGGRAGKFLVCRGGYPFKGELQNLGGLKILMNLVRMDWRNVSFLCIIMTFIATLVVISMYAYKM